MVEDEAPVEEEKKYGEFVIKEGTKSSIIKPGDDYTNEALYEKYQEVFNKQEGPSDYNLAANPSE